MSELFDEEKESLNEEEFVEGEEEVVLEDIEDASLDARRRLENLLEERRLRNELEDFLDY